MSRFLINRQIWPVPILIWAVLAGLSWFWNTHEMRRGVYNDMAGEARQIFRIIEAARLWNAQHGGVYGLRNSNSPSNPYLDAPEKDIITPAGRQLTLLNPAYMTRQMAEVIQDQSGVRIHITSLKPINPKNAANAWESEALRRFETGQEEFFQVTADDTPPMARYMAPLITRQACLKCHEHQGYKVGDVRGGIAVSYNAGKFLDSLHARQRQFAIVHLGVWLLLSGLTLYGLRVMRRQFLQLKNAKEQQDRLVETRTAQLRDEMRERKEAESFLRMLVHSSGEAIFGVDKRGRCIISNPMAERLLGFENAEAMRGVSVLALIQPQETELPGETLPACQALEQGEYVHEEDAVFIRVDGTPLAVEYRAHPIYSEGEIVGAVVTFSDITQRKQAQAHIWHKANYDPLTDLPNRDLLTDRLETAIVLARRQKGLLAVLFIDLDKFKEANDSLGHEAGDAILREVARRMQSILRETDTVARLGGDEFVVLLPQLPGHPEAERVADKLIEQLSLPYRIGTAEARISASIGIACYPDDADGAEALLRLADHAMYRAKDAGRGTWRRYRGTP